jgi:hypothetical protein
MERKEFDRLEIEANAPLPKHVANHKTALLKEKIREILEKEQIGELEP